MKILGSALLVSGTAIGAGMLGIPMATAGLGFTTSAAMLIGIWVLSYFAALLMLEVCVNTPGDKLHLNSLARETLGPLGQAVTWACVLGLLYSLTVAYIAGASSIIKSTVNIPQWILATVFTVFLGSFVVVSHRAADLLNRFFFGIKTLLMIAVLIFCIPAVQLDLLSLISVSPGLVLSAAPVVFVAFGFHHVIPSLAQYNQGDLSTLKRVIFLGSLLPLIVYLLWQMISLGIALPPEALKGEVGVFISSLAHVLEQPWLGVAVNGFANFALITSFLGVTLGLFDFLCDSFKVKTERLSHRFGVGLVTFSLPLICAIFIPESFIQMLSFGGIFFAVMAFVMPPLMVFALRHRQGSETYRCPGSWIVPMIVMITGVGAVVMGLW